MKVLGIVRETKNKWEKRVPLNPEAVSQLVEKGYKVIIQPSEIRIYSDREYRGAGAVIGEDIREADLVLGVKEIPLNQIISGKPHLFFSHTIKGQNYNMPMLQEFLDSGTTLFDYELIRNAQGSRLVFFGKFAGNAGMIDTLWGLGQRLKVQYGVETPFLRIKRAYEYENVETAVEHIRQIGREIENKGLPRRLVPFNIFLMGYGHVAAGCREILKALPLQEIDPDDLLKNTGKGETGDMNLAVFQERHMAERKDGKDFDLQDYFHNGPAYRSKMDSYLPHCSVYMNAIYWEPDYPVFLSAGMLKKMQEENQKLIIIGDITCDIDGSVAATVKSTDPENPVYIYDALQASIYEGFAGAGFANCAVDNLPCEFSREASDFFTKALMPFLESLLEFDHSRPITQSGLPEEIRKACIAHHGKLMPDFEYLYEDLSRHL